MSDLLGFSVAPGTITALSGMDDNRAYYLFDGDLSQMGRIEEFLRARGFPVVKSDVYPGFPKGEQGEQLFIQALRLVFEERVYGWWSQRQYLLQYNICTEEEFTLALEAWCASHRGE